MNKIRTDQLPKGKDLHREANRFIDEKLPHSLNRKIFKRLNFISFLHPWPEFFLMPPPCCHSLFPNGGVVPPSAPGTPGATLGSGEGAMTADLGLGPTPKPY